MVSSNTADGKHTRGARCVCPAIVPDVMRQPIDMALSMDASWLIRGLLSSFLFEDSSTYERAIC